jgi:hypothetical protein
VIINKSKLHDNSKNLALVKWSSFTYIAADNEFDAEGLAYRFDRYNRRDIIIPTAVKSSKRCALPSLANNKRYLSTDETNRRLYAFELMPLNLPRPLSYRDHVVSILLTLFRHLLQSSYSHL